MTTYKKNLLHIFAICNKLDELFAFSETITQDNETPNRLDFATLSSLSPDSGSFLALLLSTKKIFK